MKRLTAEPNGHRLPFTVDGFRHPASDALASGVKDADGLWVAKLHPLNGDASDLKRAHRMAHMFKAAPALLVACKSAVRALDFDLNGDGKRELRELLTGAIALAEVES